jgi:hypothetical protein
MFKCSNCSFSAVKINIVHQHQLHHRLKKNSIFKCFICSGIEFSNFNSYRMHMYRNHKPKLPPSPKTKNLKAPNLNLKFKCKLCLFQSYNLSLATKHVIDSHLSLVQNSSIECLLCTKQISTKNNYRQHIRRHHSTSSSDRNAAATIFEDSITSEVPDNDVNIEDCNNYSDPPNNCEEENTRENSHFTFFMCKKSSFITLNLCRESFLKLYIHIKKLANNSFKLCKITHLIWSKSHCFF